MTSQQQDHTRTPALRPVADFGIMVEFGDSIDPAIHERVLNFDTALQESNIAGIVDIIPAYTSVFVEYDPIITDFVSLSDKFSDYFDRPTDRPKNQNHWKVPVCYEGQYAPDLEMLSQKLGLSESEIVKQHTSGRYHVYMYGFAPGYAYLGGVPAEIQIPRKTEPVPDVPKGSVIIAGKQALITTLTLPSGWWNIGRSSTAPLQANAEHPFLFNVGDTVEFVQIGEAEFDEHLASINTVGV